MGSNKYYNDIEDITGCSGIRTSKKKVKTFAILALAIMLPCAIFYGASGKQPGNAADDAGLPEQLRAKQAERDRLQEEVRLLKANAKLPAAAPQLPSSSTSTSDLIPDNYGLHSDTALGWRIRRHFEASAQKMQILSKRTGASSFFSDNWEPTFSCSHELRLGTHSRKVTTREGGKWLCNIDRIKNKPLVYSLGSWGDFSFEETMHRYFQGDVEIHTFDVKEYKEIEMTPAYVNFHVNKITAGGGDKHADPPERSLLEIIEELGHVGETIDFFKIDIEGWECPALLPILRENKWPPISQMMIEMHVGLQRFKDVGSNEECVNEMFELLRKNTELQIYHKEPNWDFMHGCEYAFVRVGWPAVADEPGDLPFGLDAH